MNKLSRIITAALGGSLGAAGLAWGALQARARRALPRISGTLRFTGLDGRVEILRDRWGVPHIYASSAGDLFFAQGLVHAQDRLWQLDFGRRLGSGRLAEVLGPRALEADCFTRTIGMVRSAAAEAALLDDAERLLLERYIAGINTVIERLSPSRLPVEYSILRTRPEPWSAIDSVAWGKVLALAMAGNWESEVVRALMIARLGPERAAALEPEYPREHPLTVAAAEALGQALEPLARDALRRGGAVRPFLGRGGEGGNPGFGSNAWAVGGERSATGTPLLAGDPHLSLMLPTVWYEVHLCGGPYHVAGVSLPGVPGVIMGHNQDIAWSVTNAGCDVQDVYIERFESGTLRYATLEGWAEADLVREEIRVRGRSRPEVLEVPVTRHGPIIGRLVGADGQVSIRNGRIDLPGADFGELLPDRHAEYGLALRWTALEPANSFRGILRLNLARNWDEFREALSYWTEPALNVVYADRHGHIGYQLAGRVPRRPNGASPVPIPGWSGLGEWDGMIPAGEKPASLDPPTGYVVSANSRIADDSYRHHLSYEWMNGYRAQRIASLIETHERVDLADFAAWQMDFYSLPGLQLAALAADLLADLSDGTPLERQALLMLREWDGYLTAESPAGAVYQALLRELQREVFADLGDLLPAYLGSAINPLFGASATTMGRTTPLLLAALRAGDGLPLLNDRSSREILRRCFGRAVAQLRRSLGSDARRWRWGALHQIVASHPLGEVRPLNRLFSRGPFPFGGDTDTVCQVAYHPTEGFGGLAFAAGYRMVCDPLDWDRSLSVIAGGQSGHVASRHYDDQLRLWRAGRLRPMLWSRSRVEEHSSALLLLLPEDAA